MRLQHLTILKAVLFLWVCVNQRYASKDLGCGTKVIELEINFSDTIWMANVHIESFILINKK